MVYVNKKWVHSYVNEWFNFNHNQNWFNTNDWENEVFMKIAQYYFENEFAYQDWNDKDRNKLFSLIKNDPLYVKNYKQWWQQNALKEIKKDF